MRVSKSTKAAYRNGLNQIKKGILAHGTPNMLTSIGSIDLTVFTYDHFLLFIQWAFQNTSNKPGTLASYRSAIKDYYKQQGVAVPREYDEDMKDLFQAQKLHAVTIAASSSVREAAILLGCSERSVREWVHDQAKLSHLKGSKARKRNTGNNGAVPILPDAHALVNYMKDLRRQELPVTSAHMMQFLPLDHMAWIENYMATRKTGYQSLLRLLQHFAGRHGFSKQRIYRKKKTQDDLELTRLAFGKQFHENTRM
ncbi:hypothetical protein DYB37_008630 [Aphanomyces astaci]|uniref:Core-binding (CB) domain-containing protein n=1 Tax=Aphanomyces astaci TaxID=112090 RepID=A0A418EMU6_APHAT|nr:hypothetical protein DYB37_008630 [Aphanomyces astaci]